MLHHIAQSFLGIGLIHQKILSVVNSSPLIYLIPKNLTQSGLKQGYYSRKTSNNEHD